MEPVRLFRILRARPRLSGAMLVGVVSLGMLPHSVAWPTRSLLAWNIGVSLYLILAWTLMARSSHESMQQRARELDDGAVMILLLSLIAVLASLGAIVLELLRAKSLHHGGGTHMTLAAATILLSWAFVHTSFALHYAHEYYSVRNDPKAPCLQFPDDKSSPTYGDFMYFSFTIGATAQTSDVAVAAPLARRLVLVHSIFSFFFNTTLLAMAVNIAAGLM